MDPVTVIGILGVLCHLIETSNHLLKIAKTLKEGEKDLAELCNDVAFFEEGLKGFDRVLRSRQTSHHISTSVIRDALEESSSTIQELRTRLSGIGESDVPTIRRMRWLQNKSAVRKLHDRMKTQSGMLQSFLALAHTFVSTSSKLCTCRLIGDSVKHFSMSVAIIPNCSK